MIKNLDAIIATAKPGILELEPGLYTTMGCNGNETPDGQPLKPGVCIKGAGIGKTIILSIRPMTDGQSSSSVILGLDANAVSDCTIDGGVTEESKLKRNGIYMRGTDSQVLRCQVLRVSGNWAERKESFGIGVSLTDPDSFIQQCSVSDPVGDYHTLMQGHSIIDCSAAFNFWTRNSPGFRMAYNIGFSKGSILKNSTAIYATAGVYCDESMDGATIEDCVFHCCKYGLYLNAEQATDPSADERSYRNITFRRNKVLLDGSRPGLVAVLLEHGRSDNEPTNKNCICGVDIVENQFDLIHDSGQVVYACNIGSSTPRELTTDSLGISKVRMINNQYPASWKIRNKAWNAEATEIVTRESVWDKV